MQQYNENLKAIQLDTFADYHISLFPNKMKFLSVWTCMLIESWDIFGDSWEWLR